MASASDDLVAVTHASLPDLFTSPSERKFQLQLLLDKKEKQLQQADALGQRVLAQQIELEEKIRHLQDLNASDEDLDAETRDRYRELLDTIKAWDLENTQLTGAFGPKSPVIPVQEPPCDEPKQPKDSPSSAARSRRAKNAAHRADDVEFAFEIGNGLLTEVRRLCSLIGERDKAIQDMKEEKDDLEKSIESLRTALRSQEQSSDKFKEENWNLEVTLQALRAQLSDTQSTTQKLESEHKRLTNLLSTVRESADKHRDEAERTKATFDEFKVSGIIPTERTTLHIKEGRADLERRIESLHAQEQSANSTVVRLEETVQQLHNYLSSSIGSNEIIRAQATSSKNTIAHLDETVQQLRNQLSGYQHGADSLIQILRAHEQKLECEALYVEGRIVDAAAPLLEMDNTTSEEVKANNFIMDWLAKFKTQCISKLEIIGSEALGIEKQDEAIAAYSTALLLGPSSPNAILIKWVRVVLIRSSTDEVLSAAAKMNIPRFVVYQAICNVLEQDGRVSEAIECFQQLQSELGDSMDNRSATDEIEWVTDFKTRYLKIMEHHGDAAMDSGSYKIAVDHYTTALTLSHLSTNLLTKRSKARAAVGSWEGALEDADAVIKLTPSSPYGYERKHAALLGAHRFDEAINAYNDMLVKLEQSSNPVARELRNNFVSPSQTIATIRASVKQTQRGAPLVLIDTATGRLCDHQARMDMFEADPKSKALIASTLTKHDNSRITQTVKRYFQYATFSHTWEGAEPLHHDLLHRSVNELAPSPTAFKLVMFCVIAREAGLRWAWSDTCCVDKKDSSVLQESLTSMFKWYHASALTIIHLKDIPSDSKLVTLEGCFWNTRAWTLQEFFASRVIRFYTNDWKRYHPRKSVDDGKDSAVITSEMVAANGVHENADNDKRSSAIMCEMAAANGVDAEVLLCLRPGSENVRQKLRLAAARMASKQEDIAYSLFGIFGVSISINYGEGQEYALGRLLQEVLTQSGDVTILAWTGMASEYNSCLPAEIGVYRESASPHIPPPIEDDEMDALVTELRTTPYLDSAVMLYDRLALLPPPRPFSRRLSLCCIVFPLKGQPISKDGSPGVYCAMTSALRNVEIETMEDLTGQMKLVLVHPWLKCLLDPSEDPIEDGDAEPITPLDDDEGNGESDIHIPASSHTTFPAYDKPTRALRLFARLRQPFGALLLSHQSHNDYKRVAPDHPIRVQLQRNISPRYLAQMVRTLDIL